MSEGPFSDAFYESDTGDIHNIVIQPETALLVVGTTTNTIPAGPATSDLPIDVSKGRRGRGLKPRLVRFRVTSGGTTGVQVGSVLELAWLNPATFLSVTRPAKQPVTYRGGITGILIGNTPEQYRG